MSASPSGSGSESVAAAGTMADAADSSVPVAPDRARATPRLPLWLLTLGAGLIAGLISWAGGEAINPAFRPRPEAFHPPNYRSLSGYQKEAVDSRIAGLAERAAQQKKAAASFGLLGLVLAVGLALVGAWSVGSSRAALLGTVAGGLVGAAVGAVASWAAIPLFFRFQTPDSGLLVLFLTHAAIFAGVGAAAGLALGLSLGLSDRAAMARAILGGLLGALVGTTVLEVVNSLAFPLMRTYEPIASEGVPRCLMYSCVAAVTALSSGVAASRRPRDSAPHPVALHRSPPAIDS